MVEVKDGILKIFDKYEKVEGRKILENLKKFEFRQNEEAFERACLLGAVEYFESKDGEITDEEFLALLIRLTIMHFVAEKWRSSMWYLILWGLLFEKNQKFKMSEVVQRFEEQFIEYMEILEKAIGDGGIKMIMFTFLFIENADFTFRLLNITENGNKPN